MKNVSLDFNVRIVEIDISFLYLNYFLFVNKYWLKTNRIIFLLKINGISMKIINFEEKNLNFSIRYKIWKNNMLCDGLKLFVVMLFVSFRYLIYSLQCSKPHPM